MTWRIFLVITHIIGTVLGAGGATFLEIFYLKALKDGVIDPYESSTLKTLIYVLRVGMAMVVLSGFGFFLQLRLTGRAELLYEPRLWAKMIIVVILVLGVVAWQAKRVPKNMAGWFGGAISLTSWYAALILGAWRGLEASLLEIMTVYVAVIIVVAIVFAGIRKLLKIKT